MKKIRVGINGFGRIGRLAFRRMIEDGDFEVVAINNGSGTPANLAYLLKYDTAHRTFKGHEISFDDANLIFDGKKIPVFKTFDQKQIPWGKCGADVILECTGKFKGIKDSQPHIESGAKAVIISAPADAETPTVVYGVNDDIITKDMNILSGASCTTNCLAPVMKVIEKEFGLEGGFMTTIHAYTNDQATLDVDKEKDFRRGRASAANIVPTSSGAAKALHLVLPSVKGKMAGGAIRVPVIDGSLVDLSLTLKRKVTKDEINAAMKKASQTYLKGVLDYTEDQIVSTDIMGNTAGGIFDATQTVVMDTPDGKQYVKVVAWYDNEYSYTCQYVRTAKKVAHVLGLDK